jgi:AAA domain
MAILPDKPPPVNSGGTKTGAQPSPGPRPRVQYQAKFTDTIPAELKALAQWVVWKYELNKERTKWTKVPYRARNTQRKASTTDPTTWGTHDEAVAAFEAMRGESGAKRVDGIGFVFSPDDPYVGVDLDYCLDEQGVIRPWAKLHIENLTTYGEISPSRRGIKFIVKGELPGHGRKRTGFGEDETGAVEMYGEARFFTITGDHLDGHPTTVADLPHVVAATYEEVFGPADKSSDSTWTIPITAKPTLDATDDDLLRHAYRSKNGHVVQSLYRGTLPGGKTTSEATAALLFHLAFWTGKDANRMDRLFRGSGLMRSKWDDRRGSSTWGANEIASAIEKTGDVYTPRSPKKTDGGNGQAKSVGGSVTAELSEGGYSELSDQDMGIVRLDSIECRAIRWLWRYRFSRGALSMVVGDGGLGKSQLLLWIAALVSNGGPLPDGSGNTEAGDVVIVSAEDRPDDTIVPRLRAMGANLARITLVTAKATIRKPGKPTVIHPASFQDIPYWTEIFRRRPGCKLFIADPLPSYLGRGVNDSKNIEIRNIMEPFLDAIIAPADISMIGNAHLNKSVDAKTPMHRIAGSIAYGNLPRNVHFVVRDPEEPKRRFFVQGKCNNAPDDLESLAFKIEPREVVNSGGEVIETAIPVFEAEGVKIDLGEAVNGKPSKRGPSPEKTTKAANWLYDFLTGRPGPTPLGAIFDAAGEAGLVGHKRAEDNKWSNAAMLYLARKQVPELLETRSGSRIDDLSAPCRAGGRDVVHWYLVGKDAAF